MERRGEEKGERERRGVCNPRREQGGGRRGAQTNRILESNQGKGLRGEDYARLKFRGEVVSFVREKMDHEFP